MILNQFMISKNAFVRTNIKKQRHQIILSALGLISLLEAPRDVLELFGQKNCLHTFEIRMYLYVWRCNSESGLTPVQGVNTWPASIGSLRNQSFTSNWKPASWSLLELMGWGTQSSMLPLLFPLQTRHISLIGPWRIKWPKDFSPSSRLSLN